MTNSWTDIANSTFVLVWGANPSENHPACMAHINRARFPKDFFPSTDARSNKTAAKMWVVDPRKSRTAVLADRYIRIRPGTDIAFANGLMKYMIDKIDSGLADSDPVKTAFFGYLNQAGRRHVLLGRQRHHARSAARAARVARSARSTRTPGSCSTRPTARRRTTCAIACWPPTARVTDDRPGQHDASRTSRRSRPTAARGNTVYNALRSHLAPYTAAEVMDICGLTQHRRSHRPR